MRSLSFERVGRRLPDLRWHRTNSQEEPAAEVGMLRTYVGHIERGERILNPLQICRLPDARGVERTALLTDDLAEGIAPASPGKVQPGGPRRPPRPRRSDGR